MFHYLYQPKYFPAVSLQLLTHGSLVYMFNRVPKLIDNYSIENHPEINWIIALGFRPALVYLIKQRLMGTNSTVQREGDFKCRSQNI